MSFLLDTNVVSEWVRPHPDPNVISWLAEVDEDRVFVSVISFAEIRRGVEMLPAGRRRERLATWLAEDLAARFEERILDIDPYVAETWGVVMARAEDRPDARVDGCIRRRHGGGARSHSRHPQRQGLREPRSAPARSVAAGLNVGAQWFRRTLAGATGSSRIFFSAVCLTGECLGSAPFPRLKRPAVESWRSSRYMTSPVRQVPAFSSLKVP